MFRFFKHLLCYFLFSPPPHPVNSPILPNLAHCNQYSRGTFKDIELEMCTENEKMKKIRKIVIFITLSRFPHLPLNLFPMKTQTLVLIAVLYVNTQPPNYQLSNYPTIQLSNYPTIQLSNYPTINYTTIQLSNYPTINYPTINYTTSNYPTIQSNHLTIHLSNYLTNQRSNYPITSKQLYNHTKIPQHASQKVKVEKY